MITFYCNLIILFWLTRSQSSPKCARQWRGVDRGDRKKRRKITFSSTHYTLLPHHARVGRLPFEKQLETYHFTFLIFDFKTSFKIWMTQISIDKDLTSNNSCQCPYVSNYAPITPLTQQNWRDLPVFIHTCAWALGQW